MFVCFFFFLLFNASFSFRPRRSPSVYHYSIFFLRFYYFLPGAPGVAVISSLLCWINRFLIGHFYGFTVIFFSFSSYSVVHSNDFLFNEV